MLNPHSQSGTQVRVNKFVVIETGTYNNIMHRPFRAHLSADVEQDLYSRLNPASKYSPSLFSGIATRFIQPDATPTGQVAIHGGWEMSRLRWVMELEWITGIGSQLIQIVTGYSDVPDLSLSGLIDPNLPFYINNSFIFRRDIQRTPLGDNIVLSPVIGGQVLIDNHYNGLQSQNVGLARPSDVIQLGALYNNSLMDQLNDSEVFIEGPTLTNEAKLSMRKNANPATYISHVLDSHRRSYLSNRAYGANNDAVIEEAVQHSYDPMVSKDYFLKTLAGINGTAQVGNTFTLNDLARIDPNYPNVMVSWNSRTGDATSQKAMFARHHTGQSDGWEAPTYLTQVAATLANAVPGIMTDCALAKVHVTATNLDGGGRFRIATPSANGFINIDLSHFLQTFIDRIETELLYNLSFGHEVSLALDINCDIVGDTRVDLTINGEHGYYVTPTFCDALSSPVVVGEFERVFDIANMFHKVMENTTENYQGAHNVSSFASPGTSSATNVDDLDSVL